ncbi:mannose-1-phosphate guanylyltransferase/mannose-6-phosphate isomerase, partial [Pseudomonas fluorescens]
MITPVLLCGGSGTRLWPLSRKTYPKQFAPMAGADTLFQQTAQRVTGADFAPPVVLTAADFRFIVTEQLAAIELGAEAVLIEPEGRNTAPAVLVAALHLAKADPQGVM